MTAYDARVQYPDGGAAERHGLSEEAVVAFLGFYADPVTIRILLSDANWVRQAEGVTHAPDLDRVARLSLRRMDEEGAPHTFEPVVPFGYTCRCGRVSLDRRSEEEAR